VRKDRVTVKGKATAVSMAVDSGAKDIIVGFPLPRSVLSLSGRGEHMPNHFEAPKVGCWQGERNTPSYRSTDSVPGTAGAHGSAGESYLIF